MSLNRPLKVVGFDPSLRNWGVAQGTLNPAEGISSLEITSLDVIQPALTKTKQVRQNSLDIQSANQLAKQAMAYAKDADLVFIEVPVGSQSARAMASYGICIGVIGALEAMGVPIIQLNPTEVKVAVTGKKTATKEEMIKWARNHYPFAPWPTYKELGQVKISEAKAEHMADATAAIHAGVLNPQYQQVVRLLGIQ